MRASVRFVGISCIWATGIVLIIGFGALVTSGGSTDVLRDLPLWIGVGLWLGSLPAGVMMANEVFSEGVSISDAIGFSLGAVGLALATLLFVGYLAPMAARAGIDGSSDPDGSSPSVLTLSELRTAASASASSMLSQIDDGVIASEWQANILVWHYTRRLAAFPQVILFAFIGLLSGYWGARISSRATAQALYWSLGGFLIISTYLAGENSFELVALTAAGPVFFTGFFVLIIPPALLLGLAIPTAIALCESRGASA